MCEVWKWIIIGDVAVLLPLRILATPALWRGDTDSRWFQLVARHLRL
jgi:hypothetical protein